MEQEMRYCSLCKQERSLDNFTFKYKSKGIRNTRCRFCMSDKSKEHYRDNVQIYVERARVRTDQVVKENAERLYLYLLEHPCVDCGNTDTRVLEFDHVRGKKAENISRMVLEGFSWSAIEAEIAKCEVRCANCHRIKTGERGGFWRNLLNS